MPFRVVCGINPTKRRSVASGAVHAKKRASVINGAVLPKKRRSVLMGAVLLKMGAVHAKNGRRNKYRFCGMEEHPALLGQSSAVAGRPLLGVRSAQEDHA